MARGSSQFAPTQRFPYDSNNTSGGYVAHSPAQHPQGALATGFHGQQPQQPQHAASQDALGALRLQRERERVIQEALADVKAQGMPGMDQQQQEQQQEASMWARYPQASQPMYSASSMGTGAEEIQPGASFAFSAAAQQQQQQNFGGNGGGGGGGGSGVNQAINPELMAIYKSIAGNGQGEGGPPPAQHNDAGWAWASVCEPAFKL